MSQQQKKVLEMKDLRPEFFTGSNKCTGCIYKSKVPGSAHSQCSKHSAFVNLNNHGVQSGWAFWPYDFDPVWVDSCDSYFNENSVNAGSLSNQERIQGLILYTMEKSKALKVLAEEAQTEVDYLIKMNKAISLMENLNNITEILRSNNIRFSENAEFSPEEQVIITDVLTKLLKA